MSIYKIPLKFKTGEFKFSELNSCKEDESLNLDYDTEYQMITYKVPMYENEARIYTVPRDFMPGALTAVYGDSGELDTADNSGNYPVENMFMLDYEPLGVMLMCTNCNFQSMLFGLAAAAVEERIKSRLLDKIDKTDDFQFISEEWD